MEIRDFTPSHKILIEDRARKVGGVWIRKKGKI
jgi:hypothetical protein